MSVVDIGLKSLTNDLRPYQRDMVDHLWEYKHVLTADEMGVGKTIECIALDAVRREQYRQSTKAKMPSTLVVAPLTGVIDQWVEEFNKWNPSLKVRRINAKKRHLLLAEEADVYVIHHEALRLMKDELEQRKWLHVIIDEAHRIKNRKTKTAKAAKAVGRQAKFRTAATGTPIENRTDEVWNIFNWLYPNDAARKEAGLGHWTKKLLNSYWRFYEHYVLYEVDPDYGYHKVIGVRNTKDFRNRFGPLYIRRLKRDVLKDLPPKQYTEYKVDLPPKQRKAYDDMKASLIAWVGENEDQPVVAPVVIAQLIRLQQFTLGYGSIIPTKVNKRDGSVEQGTKLMLQEPSIKLDALMNILSDLGDAQAIVFSTSKQAIEMASTRLEKEGISCSMVTGDVTDAARAGNIHRFQEGKSQVFLATIRAGGVGMNLQNASNVIFLDRDWSPAKNQQAEDRAHRSGQTDAVNIIDIVARDTIDQRKHRTIEQKWSWIRETIGA